MATTCRGTCHLLLIICLTANRQRQATGGSNTSENEPTPSTIPNGKRMPNASICIKMCAHNVESCKYPYYQHLLFPMCITEPLPSGQAGVEW